MGKFDCRRDKVLWHAWQRGLATREGGEIGTECGGFATLHIATPHAVLKLEDKCGVLLRRLGLTSRQVIGHFLVIEDMHGHCHVFEYDRGCGADDSFADRQKQFRLQSTPGYRLRKRSTRPSQAA